MLTVAQNLTRQDFDCLVHVLRLQQEPKSWNIDKAIHQPQSLGKRGELDRFRPVSMFQLAEAKCSPNPNGPLLRALWSLSDGVLGVFKRS